MARPSRRKQKDTAQGTMLRQMRDDGKTTLAAVLGNLTFESDCLIGHFHTADIVEATASIAECRALLSSLERFVKEW